MGVITTWLWGETKDVTRRAIFYPKRKYLITAFVIFFLSWGFLKTWSLLNHRRVVVVDRFIVERLDQLRTPGLDSFFTQVTLLGTLEFVLLLFGFLSIFLIVKRRKRAAFVSLLSLTAGVCLVLFFKHLFARPRPFGCLGLSLDCFSYPSGHVTLSFYFYGLLGYLLHRFFFPSKTAFFFIMGFSFSLVALVAFSRLYLGVHYLSDLAGGVLLGGILLSGAIILIDLLY